ncbi:MAG: response regulator [Blastocatellia bacterium]|nr:response regulator [Blastocatellia bacterium]MBK6424888.1 response regulator [Blastocatellia bacterium]
MGNHVNMPASSRDHHPMLRLGSEPSNARLLIVDDEESVRSLLHDLLRDVYQCDVAACGEEALALVDRTNYNVVLSDIMMPGMSGIELLERIKAERPDTSVIMVSANHDTRRAVGALRQGAYDYIVKPFELEEVELSVQRALEHQRLVTENRVYQTQLEQLVEARTEELRLANDFLQEKSSKLAEMVHELSRTYRSTLGALAMALDARDAETRGHSERVVAFSLRLGVQIGLSKEELTNLERGALLHDVGKIGVRDAILLKPAPLTAEEWLEMKLHPEFGRAILAQVPFLKPAIPVVAEHHERWDGNGYPNGLEGDAIDIKARVFAVADCIDAVTSDRPYRRAANFETAGAELRQYIGSQFDPKIVEAFFEIPLDEWRELRRRANELSILHGEDQMQAVTEAARSFGVEL